MFELFTRKVLFLRPNELRMIMILSGLGDYRGGSGGTDSDLGDTVSDNNPHAATNITYRDTGRPSFVRFIRFFVGTPLIFEDLVTTLVRLQTVKRRRY